MGSKEQYKLVTIKVRANTYFHLKEMAKLAGYKHAGMVVDKLIRNVCVERRGA